MKKLREIIENAHYNGKLPKGFTPYMIETLIGVYNDLARSGAAEFIESEIRDILNKCGIRTEEHGIGWIAYQN